MKKILLTLTAFLALYTGMQLHAQDVQSSLNEALSSYQSGNLENTRFALQQALTAVNQAIAREILDLLPAAMSDMPKVEDGDNVTGTSYGFAGLYVSRSYEKDTTASSSVEIVSDSPFMAGINALLTMPQFIASDPNQKRIKIGNYKALLVKSEGEGDYISYEIQVPFTNSLLTFKCTGINDENKVISLANSLPVDKIAKLAE